MSANEWYVIDTRRNAIVNCITTSGPVPSLAGFEDAEHLRLDLNPSPLLLEQYEFWNKRP